MPKRTVTPAEWFAEKVPSGWLSAPPEVTADTEEVVVVLPLADDAGDVRAFRAATKDQRMAIAAEAQDLFGRTVSWGVRRDGAVHLFTHLAVPAMTRLRQPERRVLDTLVAGGVARSRSEALAWCVRHVAETEGDWLAELRDALQAVDEVRRDGPKRAKGAGGG
jgi:hypothetical protein